MYGNFGSSTAPGRAVEDKLDTKQDLSVDQLNCKQLDFAIPRGGMFRGEPEKNRFDDLTGCTRTLACAHEPIKSVGFLYFATERVDGRAIAEVL